MRKDLRPLTLDLRHLKININDKTNMGKMTKNGWQTLIKVIIAIASAVLGAIGGTAAAGL